MADNYLERKMEEHRAAASRRNAVKLTPAGCRPGKMIVNFPPRRVYVIGGLSPIGNAVIAGFTNAGCRVAFCGCDRKGGAALAQATGSQFHPLDHEDSASIARSMDMVTERWDAIDVVVRVFPGSMEDCARSLSNAGARVIDIVGNPVDDTDSGMTDVNANIIFVSDSDVTRDSNLPRDVAALCLFLSSPAGIRIRGQRICLD